MIINQPLPRKFGGGEYEAIRLLGEGGFARVYMVQDNLNQLWALKQIKPEIIAEDPRILERFEREARIQAGLRHSHIARVHSFNSQEGYLVIEYVDGKTLRDLLDDEYPRGMYRDLDTALEILRPIEEALTYIHKNARFAHLDVTPRNILIQETRTLLGRTERHIVLADFGLARVIDHEGKAKGGASLYGGTPPYWAPEQVDPAKGTPGTRSDIYALGLVIGVMLTGRRAQEVLGILRETSNTLPPMLPPEVMQVLRRATDEKPENRHASVKGLVTDFTGAVKEVEGGRTQTASPDPIEEVKSRKEEGTPTNPRRRAFFNRLIAEAGTIGLLTLLGSFLIIKEQQAFDAQRESQLTQLRIGFDPIGNNPGGELVTSSLNDDLSKYLGMPVTSVVGTTYSDTANALGGGNIDVGWLSPLSYLYAHQQYGAKVILRRLNLDGQKTYRSYFITRKNSRIRNLNDLKGKGKRFAFVDKYSTSGNLVPRYELKNHSLDPDNGKDIQGFYAGSQDEVIQHVLSGDAAAGAVSSDNYDAFQAKFGQKGSDLIPFYISSVNIPEGPIAVRKDLQRYDTLSVEEAFFTIRDESPDTLHTLNIGGFAKATDDTYQVILDIVKSLQINLSAYFG